MSTLRPIKAQKEFWVDPSSRAIHFRTWVDGSRKTRSTGIKVDHGSLQVLLDGKDQKEIERILRPAKKVSKDLLRNLLGESSNKKSKIILLVDEEWERWVELMKASWAERTTFDIIEKGKKHILPFFGNYLPERINENAWEEYISHKRSEGKVKKLKSHRTYLSMYLHYLLRKEVIKKVPRLRNPDSEVRAGKVYSKKEIDSLLEKANDELRLQILMGLKMGMRFGEITNLRWDRVHLKEGVIRLLSEDTKTRKARSVPIHEDVVEELEALSEAQVSQFVFPSPQNPEKPITRNRSAWHRLKERSKVKGRFHDLRHTCATHMAHSNIAPSIACRILGMSLEVYDKIYCNPSESELKKSLDRIDWEGL